MRFRAAIELGGKTATGIRVPPEVVESLGAGKRPAVHVTVGGHAYRTTVGVMGGQFMLPLSAVNRSAAGVAPGDPVDVRIELDTQPRTVEVPTDLAAALAEEPAAKRIFDALSYSQQRWFVLNIEGAKTQATRDRRVAAAVSRLAEGRGQR